MAQLMLKTTGSTSCPWGSGLDESIELCLLIICGPRYWNTQLLWLWRFQLPQRRFAGKGKTIGKWLLLYQHRAFHCTLLMAFHSFLQGL